jgi:hypothetical protein
MMREIVVDGDAVRGADDLEPPLDDNPSAIRSRRYPSPPPAASELTLCADQRLRRRLRRATAAVAAPADSIVRLPVDVVAHAKHLRERAASARAPALSAPTSSSPRRGTRFTRRRNASITASKSA